ncbi:MAG: hypothetical protein WA854_09890 [Candidatus Binataceae bacterium]
MRTDWRTILSPRRLPKEYSDVVRVVRYFGFAGLLIGGVFVPGRHYVLYFGCVFVSLFAGRVVGGILHARVPSEALSEQLATAERVKNFVFITLALFLTVIGVFFFWTTRQLLFAAGALIGAATLSYAVGRLVARIFFGCISVGLIVLSLRLYIEFLWPAFLVTAGFSAFMAWGLLLKKNADGSRLESGSETFNRAEP